MKINRRSGVINRVSAIFLLMSFMIFFSACGKEKEAGQKPAEPAAAAAEESAAGYSTEAIPENNSEKARQPPGAMPAVLTCRPSPWRRLKKKSFSRRYF